MTTDRSTTSWIEVGETKGLWKDSRVAAEAYAGVLSLFSNQIPSFIYSFVSSFSPCSLNAHSVYKSGTPLSGFSGSARGVGDFEVSEARARFWADRSNLSFSRGA